MRSGKTIANIFIWVSIIPYVFLVGVAIYAAVNGFTFFSSYTGIEAVINSLALWGGLLCVYPILPACVVYQIIYFLVIRREIARNKIS